MATDFVDATSSLLAPPTLVSLSVTLSQILFSLFVSMDPHISQRGVKQKFHVHMYLLKVVQNWKVLTWPKYGPPQTLVNSVYPRTTCASHK